MLPTLIVLERKLLPKSNRKQWETTPKIELWKHGKWDPTKIHPRLQTDFAAVTGGGVRGGSSGDLRHTKLHLKHFWVHYLNPGLSKTLLCQRHSADRCAFGKVRTWPWRRGCEGLKKGVGNERKVRKVTKWHPKGGQRVPKGSPKAPKWPFWELIEKTPRF